MTVINGMKEIFQLKLSVMGHGHNGGDPGPPTDTWRGRGRGEGPNILRLRGTMFAPKGCRHEVNGLVV